MQLDPAALARMLDPSEIVRMRSFHDRAIGHRWSLFRVALRAILGGCLGLPACRVDLALDARGKPHLVAGGRPALSFNLTHAGGCGILAVARSPVGVDLEQAVAARHESRLARRAMNDAEQAAYRRLDPADKPAAFLRLWTRKEAYLKATGEGLSVDPRAVAVNLAEPARLLGVAGRPGEEDRWFLHHLAPWPGTVGALATRIAAPRLRWFDWAAPPAGGGKEWLRCGA